MSFRKATNEDLISLYEIEEKSYFLSDQDSISEIKKNMIDIKDDLNFLYIVDNNIAGLVTTFIQANSTYHLHSITVVEKYRERGVGKILLDEWVRRIDEVTTDKYTLKLQVRANNLFARKLYARFGFVEVEIVKAYYKNPEDTVIKMAISKVSKKIVPSKDLDNILDKTKNEIVEVIKS